MIQSLWDCPLQNPPAVASLARCQIVTSCWQRYLASAVIPREDGKQYKNPRHKGVSPKLALSRFCWQDACEELWRELPALAVCQKQSFRQKAGHRMAQREGGRNL